MAPSPWPDYQCTEPKAPDKKDRGGSAGAEELADNKESGEDKCENEIELTQLKPQVTALDECALKALLDEAMTLRFSEDVEGKSVLLKGLFEEVNAKKSPRTLTAEAPKQCSSSCKPNKKSKIRRSHVVSDQNEISNYSKNKSDSKTSSKSILGPKNVDANESNLTRDHAKANADGCKISNVGKISDHKRGKQNVNNSNEVRKQFENIDEMIKSCDVAKIVTIPGGNKNPSDGKNSKNMIRIPPVSDIDKRPKEHYTPNIDIDKISRKINQKDIDQVKALSQGPGVKEILIPSTQLNSYKVTGVAVVRNQTEADDQLTIEEKTQSDFSDVTKGVNSENDLTSCFLRDISIIRGDEQFVKIKKIDENGNAVCPSKVDDGRKGKTRRVKVKNDKNTVMSQNIEGYRGDTDIEAVIQYIESTDEKHGRKNKQTGLALPYKQGRITNKLRPVRDKSSEAIGRKGRKSNVSKLKKCNSLEEVSSSKLEDLTHSFPNNSVSECLDHTNITTNLSHVHDTNYTNNNKTELISNNNLDAVVVSNLKYLDKKEIKSENESAGESEFHIVRKKQRKKKKTSNIDDRRNSKSAGIGNASFSRRFNDSHRGLLKNFGYLEENRGRKPAASVPPSDKSGDSSDADSVHSLPVSSSALTSTKGIGQTESSLTSYADIARSVTTPPRGGSTPALNKASSTPLSSDLNKAHCVSSEEIPCVTLPMPKNRRAVNPSASQEVNIDKDKDYPPLIKLADKNDKKGNDLFVAFTLQLPNTNKAQETQISAEESVKMEVVSVEETVSVKCPPETKCIVESTTFLLPLEDNANKRPPVILVNEENGQESSAVNGLVFGFEVNQQLLISAQNDSSPKEPIAVTEENNTINETLDLSHSKSFNHFSIVEYVSHEWKLTLDELKNDKNGKIIYFKP